jgi:putative transposase
LESGLTQDELLKLARFTEEQIIAVQKDHQGARTADLARKHRLPEAGMYDWKAK